MKNILNMFMVCLVMVTLISCSEDEPVNNSPVLEGKWILQEEGSLEIMEIKDGYIIYFADNGQVVSEAIPYTYANGKLSIDNQELQVQTLTHNLVTIIDGDNQALTFNRNETAFDEIHTTSFNSEKSESVIARSLECEPAVWTASAVTEEVTNGGTLQLNVSKSAGTSGSVEVWLFTLPKTPAKAAQPYHLVALEDNCESGEMMIETEVTNETDDTAEIEIRLRRPTLNLEVGTQDFRVPVQK
jgi:hypothetical protein